MGTIRNREALQTIRSRWRTRLAEDLAAPPWGEAVEGVQVRLRGDRLKWKAGESPKVQVDVRNGGDRDFPVRHTAWQFELHLDGQRHFRGRMPRRLPFGPGQEHTDIPLLLDGRWLNAMSKTNVPLSLSRGRHTARVALVLHPPNGEGEPVRAFSNPIEIEILPATGTEKAPQATQESIDFSKSGTYEVGAWKYRHEVTRDPEGKAFGTWGWLYHAGKQLQGPEINDHLRTPWGVLYWVAVPLTVNGPHGWMPTPSANRSAGRLLPGPQAIAQTQTQEHPAREAQRQTQR